MKNRHIIAAALLLLTTTAAAQDRHTETAPDTGENLQTAPNAEQLRQQIETLQRQLDLLEKGRDTLAAKKPALLSDPVEPIANMNGIIPLDTLQTINEAVKIVIYNDNSWKYVRDREFVKDSSIYTKYWDTGTLFPYKEYTAVGDACIACDRSGGFAQVLSLSPQGQHPLQIRHPPSPATSGSRYSD